MKKYCPMGKTVSMPPEAAISPTKLKSMLPDAIRDYAEIYIFKVCVCRNTPDIFRTAPCVPWIKFPKDRECGFCCIYGP